MAAGIAHEFNNLLTVIQGDVGLLQSVNPSMLDRRALLDQIMQASQRAAAFTRQLLAFSRQQVLQPRPLNLSLLALRMKKMLSRLIGERFEIQLHCPEEIPAAMADEGGVEQVLINLVLNARDAMVDGGKIEISTHYIEIQRTADFENSEARPGRFICMTVADCGSGITPEVISRIFDPFFTTKEVGKGTGLGLSTIHGIVKQHEGWVEVASEVGRGSAFKIYFPVCDAAPAAIVKPAQARLPDPGHGETVLVVEDEISVRDLACAALERRGYRVLKAADGREALAVWENSSEPVELLLTDMVMPRGMSGGELARELQGRNPQLKVIYTSGYSPEIVGDHSLLGEQINFLPKPYDLQGLLNAVRLCLKGDALPRYEIPARETETALHT
jgi:CheY-like chemotaxis protein